MSARRVGTISMIYNPHQVRRQRIAIAIALVFLIAIIRSPFAVSVEAAASDLDPSFGSGGKVTTGAPQSPKSLRGIAIQSDGKIVVAGSGSNPPPQTWQDVALARFNPDG